MHYRPPHIAALPIFITILLLVWVRFAVGQPGFRQQDVVTYADCRNAWCVEVGVRDVYVATDGGIWRFDRWTGEPLEPWHTGLGFDRAVSLTGGRIILWHFPSNTLWYIRGSELLYRRDATGIWYRMGKSVPGGVRSLGATRDQVILDYGESRFIRVDPYAARVVGESDSLPGEVRWSGKRGRHPRRFPYYHPVDRRFFDPETGTLTDMGLDEYRPSYDLLDTAEQRRYICYPGLGVAVADEQRLELTLFRTGPAGNDVRAFALQGNYIWMGGAGEPENGGVSRWDRAANRWERFSRVYEFGMETNAALDIISVGGYTYIGNPYGLLVHAPSPPVWRTLNGFDGLNGPGVRALEYAAGYIFTGGERGVNIMRRPTGPVFNSGDERSDELRVNDFAADGDTIWAGGVQGLFRREPDGSWHWVGGDSVIGDEPVTALALDRRRLWVGGRSGVRELNRADGAWTAHLKEPFLKGGVPLSLEPGDSLLWVGTDRGLFRFNLNRGSWLRFTGEQGLPNERIQRLELEEDTLWIGSPGGLTRFIWNRPGRDKG